MRKIATILLVTAAFTACKEQNKPQQPAAAHEHGGHQESMMSSNANDYADSVNTGLIKVDSLKGSPHRMMMANIGESHVHIEYSSPGVKNRIIWGGLVPYDQVWVAGAHQATTIDFSKDVTIMNKPVKAGTYAFFTIPGKEKWTAILNTRFDQHLADQYNQQEDVARFEVTPAALNKQVPRLSYAVVPATDTSGAIEFAWDKLKISLPVTAKKK